MGGKGSGGIRDGAKGKKKLPPESPQLRVRMTGVRMPRWKYEALARLPEGRTAAVNAAVDAMFKEYFKQS